MTQIQLSSEKHFANTWAQNLHTILKKRFSFWDVLYSIRAFFCTYLFQFKRFEPYRITTRQKIATYILNTLLPKLIDFGNHPDPITRQKLVTEIHCSKTKPFLHSLRDSLSLMLDTVPVKTENNLINFPSTRDILPQLITSFFEKKEVARGFGHVSKTTQRIFKDANVDFRFEMTALLRHISRGEQQEVEALFKKNPAIIKRLLSSTGTHTDYASRTFKNIHPLQLAMWYKDYPMCCMLTRHMDHEKALTQIDQHKTGKMEYAKQLGMYYPFDTEFQPLLDAEKAYKDDNDHSFERQLHHTNQLGNALGKFERCIPIHYINEMCRKFSSFAVPRFDGPLNDFYYYTSLPRTVKFDYEHALSESTSGGTVHGAVDSTQNRTYWDMHERLGHSLEIIRDQHPGSIAVGSDTRIIGAPFKIKTILDNMKTFKHLDAIRSKQVMEHILKTPYDHEQPENTSLSARP